MPRKKKKNKEQKPKVIYYDDNSPIVDMSQVSNGIGFNKNSRQKNNPSQQQQPKQKSTAKEKWNTYWSAVKLMFLPMIGVLIILLVLYLFLMLISGGFNR